MRQCVWPHFSFFFPLAFGLFLAKSASFFALEFAIFAPISTRSLSPTQTDRQSSATAHWPLALRLITRRLAARPPHLVLRLILAAQLANERLEFPPLPLPPLLPLTQRRLSSAADCL